MFSKAKSAISSDVMASMHIPDFLALSLEIALTVWLVFRFSVALTIDINTLEFIAKVLWEMLCSFCWILKKDFLLNQQTQIQR